MRLFFLLLAAAWVLPGETPAKKETVQTPFGPAVRQTPAEPAPQRRPDLSAIRVEEKGDTFTFRRKTPFGESVWTRKRSELTAFDREVLAARDARAAQPPPQQPAPGAPKR